MSKVTEIEKRISEIESKQSSVNERISELMEDIRVSEECKADLLTDEELGILANRKELESIKKRIPELKNQLEDNEILKRNLEKKIVQEKENLRQEKIGELVKECQRIEREYESLSATIQEKEKEISAIREKGTILHNEWDKLSDEIVKLGGEVRKPGVFTGKVYGVNV